MFTGIVKEVGLVTHFSRYQKTQNLMVRSKLISSAVAAGDSVSVNGVCLTATNIKSDILTFDLLEETLKLTNLGLVRIGECVNLEDSLKASDKISGHFVTGHIDCMGIIKRKGVVSKNHFIEVAVPKKFMNLITAKGSVAIDGVSLTIVDILKDSFTVYLIPHTINNTILGKKNAGKMVNIEFDILAKYALNPKGASVL